MGGGGKGGKGGGSSNTVDPRAYEAQGKLADIAQQSFVEGQPVRNALMEQAQSILGGSTDLTSVPTYAPLLEAMKQNLDVTKQNIGDAWRSNRAQMEGPFNLARDTILSTTPTGGQLYSALNDLARTRATQQSNLNYNYTRDISNAENTLGANENALQASLLSDILGRGATGAYASMGSGISGFGQSANLAGQLAQAQLSANANAQNSKNSSLSGLGQGLGTMYGLSNMGGKAGSAAAPIGATLGTTAFESAAPGFFSSMLASTPFLAS